MIMIQFKSLKNEKEKKEKMKEIWMDIWNEGDVLSSEGLGGRGVGGL